ncbi:MAG: hypothetical protein JJE04_01530 [Acidobacteriia bacterium]|nr:hypothetical protein [Terriglobia bacterium]
MYQGFFGKHGLEKVIAPGKARAAEVLEKDVVAFVRGRLGLDPDEQQERLLRESGSRVLVNCARQWGKSTVTAAKVVHRAWTERGITVIVVSPSGRQSGEFIRKVKEFVRKLGAAPKGDGDNRWSVVLGNGSRIVGLPSVEATVRGFSAVSFVVVDEAARVREEMYTAVRPMLAVGDGDLWLLSTPAGQSGYFWDAWTFGGEGWTRVQVRADECGRMSRAFLEEERAAMTEKKFGQEYLCEFNEVDDGVFDPAAVQDMVDESVEELAADGFRVRV